MSEIVVLKLQIRGEVVSAKKIIQSMVYVHEEFKKHVQGNVRILNINIEFLNCDFKWDRLLVTI